MILRKGEHLIPNPGGKRCRVCGALITSQDLVTSGTSYRCPSDACIGGPKRMGRAAPKYRLRRPPGGGNRGYLASD